MSLASQIESAIIKELDRLSEVIEGELKAECPERTGTAKGSIHIEHTGQYERFVGGANKNLFFADEGNNQSKSLIVPVRAKALRFSDGSFHGSARTYYYPDRQGFVKRVADRHR